jgi:hypothetical protein
VRPAENGPERLRLGEGTVKALWIHRGDHRYLVAVTDGDDPPLLKQRLSWTERAVLIFALIMSA